MIVTRLHKLNKKCTVRGCEHFSYDMEVTDPELEKKFFSENYCKVHFMDHYFEAQLMILQDGE